MPITNTRQSNPNPITVVGPTLTERPSPKLLPVGTAFVNETSGEEYSVIRNTTTGVHEWKLTGAGGTPSLPSQYAFAGTMTAGGGDAYMANVPGAGSGTAIDYPVQAAGTLRNFRIHVGANTLTVDSAVLVKVNGATILSIPVAAGVANTDIASGATTPVLATDRVSMLIGDPGGAGAVDIAGVFTIG